MSDLDRELSAVERWYWIVHRHSPLHVASRVRVSGPLDPDALRRGLDAVRDRHPLLSVRVVARPDGSHPRWEPCAEPIGLRTVDGDGSSWLTEVDETELCVPLDCERGPLARAVAIRIGPDEWDLMVTAVHLVADGVSVLNLLREWVLAAAGGTLPGRTRVLPPTDELLPLPTGSAAPEPPEPGPDDGPAPGRLRASRPMPLTERRTRLLHRWLDGDELDALVAACRREGTTVNAAMTTALASAAAFEDGGADRFAVGSPIDVRAQLVPPVEPDEAGTFAVTVPTVVDVRLPFWDRARAAGGDLADRYRRGEHFDMVRSMFSAAPETPAAARPFLEYMEAEGPINLVLSNVGRVSFPESAGPLTLSHAQVLGGLSVNGYLVAAVTTTGSHVAWNIGHVEGVIPAERARRIADGTLALLRDAATPTTSPGPVCTAGSG